MNKSERRDLGREKVRREINQELRFLLTPRFILGIALILTAFSSAFIVSSGSRNTVLVWSAAHNLAPGHVIEDGDLKPMRVLLSENAPRYLAASADINGTTVLRTIGAEELIPSYALGSDIDIQSRRVPLSLPRSSLPNNLAKGDSIDIYSVPVPDRTYTSTDLAIKSRLVLTSISVDDIDAQKQDFGGDVRVTLLIPEADIKELLALTVNQRLVIVKRPGS